MKRTVPQAVFDSKDFRNIAKKAHKEAWEELVKTPRHMLDEGNPNHPRWDLHIFGEHVDSFMERQYHVEEAQRISELTGQYKD